ncbi:MAG: hypothetical protein IGBAC_1944 [Ignavibacteriae bacterium]|nr:MAG: hypothetical protein IGBAC_1944 [Ignavibacteriota bacterium]
MFNWTIKQERIIRIIILLFYMIGGMGIITPRFSLFILINPNSSHFIVYSFNDVSSWWN